MAALGKQVGVQPRPRVALVGLEAEENKLLAEFFPTTHVVGRLVEIPTQASPVELDLIISANIGNDRPKNIDEYARAHLILLGTMAWEVQAAPPPHPDPQSLYSADTRARSKQYSIATDLDPRLEAELRRVLPPSSLGLPAIRVRSTKGQALNDPAKQAWLAWAADPELPLAVDVRRPGYNTNLAWFPTRPTNCVGLVKALCWLWARTDRETFPNFVDWANAAEWMTAEEKKVIGEKERELIEFADLARAHRDKLDELDRRFLAAKDLANVGPRAILSTQDADLVTSVSGVLRDLGFDVRDVDSTRDPQKPKREDLQLRFDADPKWVALVEVKGHRKRGANDEDLTKIERHVQTYLFEDGAKPALKVYICNAQFGLPPDARPRPYAGNPGSAQGFCEGGIVPGVIVPTPDLFRLHRDRNTLGIEHARSLLINARGVFAYPQ